LLDDISTTPLQKVAASIIFRWRRDDYLIEIVGKPVSFTKKEILSFFGHPFQHSGALATLNPLIFVQFSESESNVVPFKFDYEV
jgi:hypothetical protein